MAIFHRKTHPVHFNKQISAYNAQGAITQPLKLLHVTLLMLQTSANLDGLVGNVLNVKYEVNCLRELPFSNNSHFRFSIVSKYIVISDKQLSNPRHSW